MNKKTIAFILLVLLFTILLGTGLYMVIEGWNFLDSLYMTVIIVTTIGFGEVHPLTEPGKIFTIIYSIVGFMLLAGFISIISSTLVEKFIIDRRGGRKMVNNINKVKNHIIVCGSGKFGRHVIKMLHSQKKAFVVLDQGDPMDALIQQSQTPNSSFKDILYQEGDPTREEILISAGLEKAYGIISCMPEDSQNLFIGVTAKKNNPKIKWTTSIVDENNSSKFYTVGADDVIRGDFVIGNRLVNSMVNQNLFGFLEQTNPIDGSIGLIVGAVEIGPNSPLIHVAIKDTTINKSLGLLIFALKKGSQEGYQLNPKPETILAEKDVIISVGDTAQIESLELFVNPKKGFWK